MHSRYRRYIRDLPISGQPVSVRVTVRRFYCHGSDCGRRTFAEPLGDFAAPHAQRTRRLTAAHGRAGLALGGSPAARLLTAFNMPASTTTVLRTLRGLVIPAVGRPTVIGVDDWALRKGRSYGSIIVDLERRRPVELLPDRSVASLAAWLRHHPQIRIVARDRSTDYARGTAIGASDATQVADRWHLLLNARQMIERALARIHPRLRRLPTLERPTQVQERLHPYPRAPAEIVTRAYARDRWEVLYDDVRRRHAAGQSLRRINKETGLARATVRKYAFADIFPRHGLRGPTPSILDRFIPALEQRVARGCENAMELWREIRMQGFAGTPRQVRRWLSDRRSAPARTTTHQSRTSTAHPAPLTGAAVPSAKQLSWLLVQEPGDLEPREHELVERIRQDDEAARVAGIGLAFCRLVRRASERTSQHGSILTAFEVWLADARACRNAVVANFARNLGQDAAAIRAALTLPWSNGQSEGQINRLKLLKRSMYGRASLELLRRRFLIRS